MEVEDKAAIELEARRVISGELKEYREHLQDQFSQLKWAVGIVSVAALGIFTFFFGQTYRDVATQVNERVLDYKIDEEIRNRLKERIRVRLAEELLSDITSSRIESGVAAKIDEALSSEAMARLYTAIDSKRSEIESLDAARQLDRLPVGVVVPSILPPERFYAFASPSRKFDSSLSIWSLADGRPVPNSTYATVHQVELPDLRGIFLRGLNVGREDGFEDPGQGRRAGDLQSDSIGNHGHSIRTKYTAFVQAGGTPNYGSDLLTEGNFNRTHTDVVGLPVPVAPETRPKNAAVYFYIKIN